MSKNPLKISLYICFLSFLLSEVRAEEAAYEDPSLYATTEDVSGDASAATETESGSEASPSGDGVPEGTLPLSIESSPTTLLGKVGTTLYDNPITSTLAISALGTAVLAGAGGAMYYFHKRSEKKKEKERGDDSQKKEKESSKPKPPKVQGGASPVPPVVYPSSKGSFGGWGDPSVNTKSPPPEKKEEAPLPSALDGKGNMQADLKEKMRKAREDSKNMPLMSYLNQNLRGSITEEAAQDILTKELHYKEKYANSLAKAYVLHHKLSEISEEDTKHAETKNSLKAELENLKLHKIENQSKKSNNEQNNKEKKTRENKKIEEFKTSIRESHFSAPRKV